MVPVSAIIITYNEENFIGKCLSSLVGVADEIIVVDSFSTDSTEEICNSFNIKFKKHVFKGYVEQKNYALTLATYPHILSLDADEALSDELVKSILGAKEKFDYDGYIFNRLNNYCGHWMKYSRLYPDKQLRLFDSRKGKWMGPNPHDRFILDKGSRARRIKGDLLHWNFVTYEEHIEKMNRFSTIGALEAFKAGRKSGPLTATLHSSWCFFRSYILNAGFLDGYSGFVSCSITAHSRLLKYAKLRRLYAKGVLKPKTENDSK
jgi:glycosyltransferase involved in cell wall biosynthesis